MSDLVPTECRPGIQADLPYVFNSWLKGYRSAQPEMRSEDFFALQHKRITALLRKSGHLRIMHPVGAPAVIAGWACLDLAPSVVHYVHVRGEYRRKHFALRLIHGRSVCTHMTPDGLVLKRQLGLRYMPHLLDGP